MTIVGEKTTSDPVTGELVSDRDYVDTSLDVSSSSAGESSQSDTIMTQANDASRRLAIIALHRRYAADRQLPIASRYRFVHID